MAKKQGFTLVEIMIVVLIIGLLAAVAVPNFLKARTDTQKNTCIDNLRQIEGALEQAKMEGVASPGWSDIVPTYIKTRPNCPSDKTKTDGAAYVLTGDRPTCTVNATDHKLPAVSTSTED